MFYKPYKFLCNMWCLMCDAWCVMFRTFCQSISLWIKGRKKYSIWVILGLLRVILGGMYTLSSKASNVIPKLHHLITRHHFKTSDTHDLRVCYYQLSTMRETDWCPQTLASAGVAPANRSRGRTLETRRKRGNLLEVVNYYSVSPFNCLLALTY